jgi:hypothetical protein
MAKENNVVREGGLLTFKSKAKRLTLWISSPRRDKYLTL